MNTNTKPVFETMSATTSEAVKVMTNTCSTALKGMQDYNSKIIEFTQANTKSQVEFIQKLVTVKSPSELIEVSHQHTRHQLETVAEQAKQLAEIARQVTLASTEPLKTAA